MPLGQGEKNPLHGAKPQPTGSKEGKFALSELGISGLHRVGGFVFEEYLKELQGYRAARVYREMSDNDPTIGGLLFAIEQTIVSAGWDVHASDESNKAAQVRDFFKSCMDDMSHTWTDLLYETFTMLVHGWAWLELVYKIRKGPEENDGAFRSQYADGAFGWRKIALRGQDTLYRWEFDEFGGTKQMYQIAPPDFATRIIPIEKSLLFRTKSNRRNPEGRSILRNAYRAWWFKKRLEEIEGIGMERDLAGLPVLTPPEEFEMLDPANLKQVDYAKRLLRNIRHDEQEGILKPFGWTLELLSTAGRRQFDTNTVIDRYDRRIAMSMLGQFIMLGMGNVGSFALSQTQQDLFMLAITGWLKAIADVFNRYAFPRLADLNQIPPELIPELRPAEVRQPQVKELGEFLAAVTQAGLLTQDPQLEDHIRALAKLPLRPDDLDEADVTPQRAKHPDIVSEPTHEQKAARARRKALLPGAGRAAAGLHEEWPEARRHHLDPDSLGVGDRANAALGALALRPFAPRRGGKSRVQYGLHDLNELFAKRRERQLNGR